MLGMASKMTRNGYAKLKSAFPTPSSFPKSTPMSEYSTLSRSHFCGKGKGEGFVRSSPEFGNSPTLALWKPRHPLTIRNARSYNASSSNSLHCGRRRASFKWFTTDGVVIGLIATNVAVFLLWKVADTDFMVKNFMISVDNIKSGRMHTLITSAFTHHDTFHFATNMVGLYFFGKKYRTVARTPKVAQVVSNWCIGWLSVVFGLSFFNSSKTPGKLSNHPYGKAPAQGASGAIAALVELGVFLYPLTFIKPLHVDFAIPGPALLLGIFIIAKDMQRLAEAIKPNS